MNAVILGTRRLNHVVHDACVDIPSNRHRWYFYLLKKQGELDSFNPIAKIQSIIYLIVDSVRLKILLIAIDENVISYEKYIWRYIPHALEFTVF